MTDNVNPFRSSLMVVIVAFCILLCVDHAMQPLRAQYRHRYLRDVRFRSGDLLFVSSSANILVLTASAFSHVGVVVVDKHSVPYVFHIDRDRRVEIVPAHLFIHKKIHVRSAIGHRAISQEANGRMIALFMSEKWSSTYRHAYWRPWLRSLHWLYTLRGYPPEKYYCSSLVARALAFSGVLDARYSHELLPHDLVSLPIGAAPYSYGPVRLLLC